MSSKKKNVIPFEWSDDMIESYSFGDNSVLESKIPKQDSPRQRPVELNERIDPSSIQNHIQTLERAKKPLMVKKKASTAQTKKKRLSNIDLSQALNEMTVEWTLQSRKGQEACLYQGTRALYYFKEEDGKEASILERIETAIGEERKEENETIALPASGFLSLTSLNDMLGNDEVQNLLKSNQISPVGGWFRCFVTSYSKEEASFEVTWSNDRLSSQKTLQQPSLCFELENRFDRFSSFAKAIIKRKEQEAFEKYDTYVTNMPFDQDVVSNLSHDQVEAILLRTFDPVSFFISQDTWEDFVLTIIQEEVIPEFMKVMNRTIFDANLMNTSNLSTFRRLALPSPSLKPSVPYSTVDSQPMSTSFDHMIQRVEENAFIAYKEPVEGMLRAKQITAELFSSTELFSMDYTKPTTLKAYRKVQSSILYQASRVVKHEWPQKVAVEVKNALAKHPYMQSLLASLEEREQEEKNRNEEKRTENKEMKEQKRRKGNKGKKGTFRSSLETIGSSSQYNFLLTSIDEYEAKGQPIRSYIERVHLVMKEDLEHYLLDQVASFNRFIEAITSSTVQVEGINQVSVTYPPNTPAQFKIPLLSLNIQITEEPIVVNALHVEEAKEKRDAWMKKEGKECENPEDECPIALVEPIVGFSFQYDTPLHTLQESFLSLFDQAIEEMQGIYHVRRFIMERLFFPKPSTIETIDLSHPFILKVKENMKIHVNKKVDALSSYLQLFDQWFDLLNLAEVSEFVKALSHAKLINPDDDDDDDDSAVQPQSSSQKQEEEEEEEGNLEEKENEENTEEVKKVALYQNATLIEAEDVPIIIDVSQLKKTLKEHHEAMDEIKELIPIQPLPFGMAEVTPASLRDVLIEKHKAIIQEILVNHAEYTMLLTAWIHHKYEQVFNQLNQKVNSIEDITRQKEYIDGLNEIIDPLKKMIDTMMTYNEVLDDEKVKVDTEHSNFKWTVYSWPSKIERAIEDTMRLLDATKENYLEEMIQEQSDFQTFLFDLDVKTKQLDAYSDLEHVQDASNEVAEITGKIEEAEEKAKLFNAREILFEQEMTEYDTISAIKKSFEPYKFLWQTTSDWIECNHSWCHGPFNEIHGETVEKSVDTFLTRIKKAKKSMKKEGKETLASIADTVMEEIEDFVPQVPMIVSLTNPGMRERHWSSLSNEVSISLKPEEPDFCLQKLIELNLTKHIHHVEKVAESAGKEFQIENALNKMENEWQGVDLQIHDYRAGTGVLKGVDELVTMLDEQIQMTQAMQFSAFKGPFEQRIDAWNNKLFMVSEVLEAWLNVQRNWMYLQPIFESPDIGKELPQEAKKFSKIDKAWRKIIAQAKKTPKALDFCDNEQLFEKFKESGEVLDQVQKGLSDYLETKRSVFARFYFLSNDELLSILSESKNVRLVNPHLRKCFEGINSVNFMEDLKIDRMISPEGEEVEMLEPVDPVNKNVEDWMLEVEGMMRLSTRHVMNLAIEDYLHTERPIWMQSFPGQCVLNGSQMYWTMETEQLLEEHGEQGPSLMLERQKKQLEDMVILVRGKLSKNARTTVGALTVIDVHARDVMIKLVEERVSSKYDFTWMSQLRYYHDEGDLYAEMVAARKKYGYEYIGNSFRLVITPLTDRCYLTLMGAIASILGGAPAGPAGTGKTETVKDLGKAISVQCVVFNCSDGLDYMAMGKFFKGLAACGAWACFDEFNRINIEVLSVIGQQIMTIQSNLRAENYEIVFEGSNIHLHTNFAVFITMNPGYAGRTELPDSLKALFRPVAMMVPDYALIGEIMFFAFGFEHAKVCGAKMVATFRLCSEQLSSVAHYDYGMRAVKTVITAAGNLKREEPEADELVLLLRALQDVNIPKFLSQDLPLFDGIISDLFVGKKRPELDYGDFLSTMKQVIEKNNLQAVPFFTTKIIQLYEMTLVRHGMMVVGPTGGGKSSNIKILSQTLTELKKQGIEGNSFEKVKIYQLNPKSITMGQMYGEFDPNTHEWTDGIMSTMYRRASSTDTPDKKWILFDGPVDAIWIENMNTVLDDNKKLCLNSGEIIKMSPEMTMMFEPEDLEVASPATVSRVGIIYMEPKGLGLDVLVDSWLQILPPCFLEDEDFVVSLKNLFNVYLASSLHFLNTHLQTMLPTIDNNLAASLLRLMDCYLERYYIKEGRDDPSEEEINTFKASVEGLFIFSLVWSIGSVANEKSRVLFDTYLREKMNEESSVSPFPNQETVFDYYFESSQKKWIKWSVLIPDIEIDLRLSYSELIVPTVESTRTSYLTHTFISNRKHMLLVGPTGTGKTVNIAQYLQGSTSVQESFVDPSVIPLSIAFSAQTTANQTQDTIDSKLDKRRKGVFGPSVGKRFVIHVDDLNMPKKEEYGAQPPIEILRQWFDQGGWYDRKELSFRNIIDIMLVASMGLPGGGRTHITPRFLRHFSIVGVADMSESDMSQIFSTILNAYLNKFDGSISRLGNSITTASIKIFQTITTQLLPTPQKAHYTFNVRDLSKVFQGMLMADTNTISTEDEILRLWIHENKRVFGDRLVSKEDHGWFKDLISSQLSSFFEAEWDSIVTSPRLIYGDFMDMRDVENKSYCEVSDMDKFKETIEEYLADFNSETKTPMNLVLFMDALEHVSRIARILRQPLGNALLLGVGGSGRSSMTRLANHLCGFKLFSVEIAKGYGIPDWREDLKTCLLEAGLKEMPTTFLFSDVQIFDELQVEDLNNILNSGDIPNLYAPEDMESIMTACRVDCQKKRISPTKINIFAQFINRVRKNMHIVICMSPLGDVFRDRIRQFPSLINCCTIDWFTNWPAEALLGVASSTVQSEDLALGEHTDSVVETFRMIHQTVEDEALRFYDTLRRRCYVTPTSYLELLSSFKKLLKLKREELNTKKERLQTGLDKISSTKVIVSEMQDELKELQPQLVKTQEEVSAFMEEIKVDKAEAEKTRLSVEAEEAKAQEKSSEATAIAEDAERDLAEALPALEEAVKCLQNLKKSDIDEIKAFKKPPGGAVLTMQVLCLMFDVKPVKKNDPENPGKKIEDWFDAAKQNLLGDSKAFIQRLVDFDRDNIPERIIRKIDPFVEMEEFTPEAVARASKACEAICMWARAMDKYHYVSLAVEPKRLALKEAQEELEIVNGILADAKGRLKEVSDRLEELEANFEKSMKKKQELEEKENRCKRQLSNAEKLIGGLGGEEARWKQTVVQLAEAYENLLGDVLVSAGTISYLGPFTSDFRLALVRKWQDYLKGKGIPHTENCSLEKTLSDPVKLRSWQIEGLPTDLLSTQNGIIVDKASRWPLFIDPQGQANRFVKNMGKSTDFCDSGMDVVKLSDPNFLRSLVNGVQFGRWVLLENIGEELDAALEPILLQQKFKQGGQEMIRIGEDVIPYNDSFRFFMTTKLSNPHYQPEIQVKVSLLNFTITMSGLEEQMLGITVEEEMPELAKKKVELVVANARMEKELYRIESDILYMLSNSGDDILDDTNLIDKLASAKVTSEEVKEKMIESEKLEQEIEEKSEEYRPVAKRASLLYFCISDLSTVDPMYQYSLPWFKQLFVRSVAQAPMADDLQERLKHLNDTFTFSIYVNICRSLFEVHKLLFSFLLTIKIMQGDNLIDEAEWRFLLSGIGPSKSEEEEKALESKEAEQENSFPETEWLERNTWADIQVLNTLHNFQGFCKHFKEKIREWRAVFDADDPHLLSFPYPYQNITGIQKLCILRCLRRDKVMDMIQTFVSEQMGDRYIEPPPFDLKGCYDDSLCTIPLVFVLSSGSDPNKDLFSISVDMGMSSKLKSIALGQGQGDKAKALIDHGMEKGEWILLQNCHLSISWMPTLEKIVEEINPNRCHPDFRLWLTSMPSPHFPASILQSSIKITKEPPKGLRANLKSTYLRLDDDKMNATNKPEEYRKLLFGLAFFHAMVIERKKFGPLGWNIPYEFNDTDFDISHSQLELYMNQYEDIPYRVLRQLTSIINYGGRITDDKDLRTADILISTCIAPEVLDEDYSFSEKSQLFRTIATYNPSASHSTYLDYIAGLPLNASPEVFGMHSNANITCAISDVEDTFTIILSLQPRSSGSGGVSREDQVIEMAKSMEAQLPDPFDIPSVAEKYPTDYHESMNTVLVQEAARYTALVSVMKRTLAEIQKALKGLVVLSSDLEAMSNAIFDQKVPSLWEDKAYPSLMPLGAWFKDLLKRLDFMGKWIEGGTPPAFWISGFFFPQGFLTGTLQNYARKYQLPIDSISFDFAITQEKGENMTEKPEDGCYIYGLFLEGARWSHEQNSLIDPKPKELFSPLPTMHLQPKQDREEPKEGVYRCPVYKILTRTGTLSTTGHSTNFVFWILLESNKEDCFRSSLVSETNQQVLFADQAYWIKAGVACFCALRYSL